MRSFDIGDCVCWKDPMGTGRDCFGAVIGFDETSFDGEVVEVAVIRLDGDQEDVEIPLEDLENLGQ